MAAETTNSFEAGLKGMFWKDRLQLNFTGYYSQIKNLQLGLRDLNTIANILGTAPETTIKGGELSFMAKPSRSLNISGGIAYNDAHFTNFTDGLCYLGQTQTQGCFDGAQDLSGHVLENAPRWKGIFNIRYDKPVSAELSGFLQTSMRYQSAVFLSDDADPRSIQPSYAVMDASIGVETTDERIKLALFIKNLTGQKYVAGISANSSDGGGVIVHTLPRDFHRYVGLSLSYQM